MSDLNQLRAVSASRRGTRGDIYRDGGDEALRRFLLVERLRGLADMIERTPDDAAVGAHIRELHGVNTLRAAADRI